MYVRTIANVMSCACVLVCALLCVCVGGSVGTCTMQQGGVDQSSYLTKKKLGGI